MDRVYDFFDSDILGAANVSPIYTISDIAMSDTKEISRSVVSL